jgi:hypothetical protein
LLALVTELTVANTLTVPMLPAGTTASQEVVVQDVPTTEALPKVNSVPPDVVEKLVPEITTAVPPAGGPESGLTPVTVGAVGAAAG